MHFFIKYFPYICSFWNHKSHKNATMHKSIATAKNTVFYKNLVILGIGSNIGRSIIWSSFHIFQNLFKTLFNNQKIKIFSTSFIYKNKAFGFTNQPDFYNATMILSTNMCLKEWLRLNFYLERRFGRSRKREFKNAPRTLDIDVIYFAGKILSFKHFTLPHRHFQERKSVLVPLLSQLGYESKESKLPSKLPSKLLSKYGSRLVCKAIESNKSNDEIHPNPASTIFSEKCSKLNHPIFNSISGRKK